MTVPTPSHLPDRLSGAYAKLVANVSALRAKGTLPSAKSPSRSSEGKKKSSGRKRKKEKATDHPSPSQARKHWDTVSSSLLSTAKFSFYGDSAPFVRTSSGSPSPSAKKKEAKEVQRRKLLKSASAKDLREHLNGSDSLLDDLLQLRTSHTDGRKRNGARSQPQTPKRSATSPLRAATNAVAFLSEVKRRVEPKKGNRSGKKGKVRSRHETPFNVVDDEEKGLYITPQQPPLDFNDRPSIWSEPSEPPPCTPIELAAFSEGREAGQRGEAETEKAHGRRQDGNGVTSARLSAALRSASPAPASPSLSPSHSFHGFKGGSHLSPSFSSERSAEALRSARSSLLTAAKSGAHARSFDFKDGSRRSAGRSREQETTLSGRFQRAAGAVTTSLSVANLLREAKNAVAQRSPGRREGGPKEQPTTRMRQKKKKKKNTTKESGRDGKASANFEEFEMVQSPLYSQQASGSERAEERTHGVVSPHSPTLNSSRPVTSSRSPTPSPSPSLSRLGREASSDEGPTARARWMHAVAAAGLASLAGRKRGQGLTEEDLEREVVPKIKGRSQSSRPLPW